MEMIFEKMHVEGSKEGQKCRMPLREGVKKKKGKSGQADRFGGGGGFTSPQPDRFYL